MSVSGFFILCNSSVHIVIVTKYRKKILKDSIAEDVKKYIEDVAIEKGYEILLWKQIKTIYIFSLGTTVLIV